ncbi:hypothetical protein LOTGIDRAFT_92970, partial [Lottia gigantea]
DDDYIPTPPDGGYGWIIVICSFVSNMIVDGIGYTFGVFLVEFVDVFKAPKSKISLIGSLLCGIYLFAGPIVSGMTNRYGCKPVAVVGSFISATAFVLSTFSPNVEVLTLTYGVIGGFGFGMIYLPAIVSVGYYFESKRALATGIAVCGSGVGTFVLAPFSKFLLDQYDWRNALLILAGIILQAAVCGMLMRPLEVSKPKPTRPRAKNMIDRIKEQTKSKPSSPQHELPPIDSKDTNKRKSDPEVQYPVVKTTKFSNGSLPNNMHHKIHEFSPLLSASDPKNIMLKVQPNGLQNIVVNDKRSKLINSKNLLAPKEDYKRPLYRKDIFYSGSVLNIPQFKSQPDMRSYIQSITTIPTEIERKEESHFWQYLCIPNSAKDTLREMMDFSLFRDAGFILLCTGNVFVFLGFYVPFVYLVDKAVLNGIDEHKAAFLVSVIGITNCFGRLVAGWLADRPRVSSLLVNNISVAITGLITMLFPFCNDYITLNVAASIFGTSLGAFISLSSIIICDLLGIEKLTNAFGLLAMFRGMAAMAGPPLAGYIYDTTSSYDISFYTGGALCSIGAILHFLL